MDIKELNLFQRLNEIRKAHTYIKKEKEVEGYLAVTHDQVTGVTRAKFVEFGVMYLPQLLDQNTVDTGMRTKRQNPIVRHEVVYKIVFLNVDAPNERAEAIVSAHANDHGDKAPGKALSYAVKAALLKVLMLESGEEDESRYSEAVSDIPEELRTQWLEEIEKITSKDKLQAFWKGASKQCEEARDVAAYNMVKSAVNDRLGAIAKKESK